MRICETDAGRPVNYSDEKTGEKKNNILMERKPSCPSKKPQPTTTAAAKQETVFLKGAQAFKQNVRRAWK